MDETMYKKIQYNLELDRAVAIIQQEKAKRVCIQLPDGLKPEGNAIADHLHAATKAEILIWAGSCYGSCDLPIEVERLGVDLLITFGHAPWIYAHDGKPIEQVLK